MLKRYAAIILLFIIGFTSSVQAQIVKLDNKEFNADSIRKEFDEAPHFSLYKDNYFTIGTAIGPRPSATNSDVKFQVSISQRLTKSTSVSPVSEFFACIIPRRLVSTV